MVDNCMPKVHCLRDLKTRFEIPTVTPLFQIMLVSVPDQKVPQKSILSYDYLTFVFSSSLMLSGFMRLSMSALASVFSIKELLSRASDSKL